MFLLLPNAALWSAGDNLSDRGAVTQSSSGKPEALHRFPELIQARPVGTTGSVYILMGSMRMVSEQSNADGISQQPFRLPGLSSK
ncbi:MAG: hypothetical protein DWB48_05025 [Nitrosomonas sp.]|nr:hypothetical protein [Nitrosomonas sp.]